MVAHGGGIPARVRGFKRSLPKACAIPLWGASLARLARLKAGEAFKLGVDEGTLQQLKAF